MIEVSHLVKRYGPLVAVDDVSFTVGEGEVVGFLGPNGAGKSTTLRILAGFLGMTSGEVKVAGFDVRDDSFEARRRIGYMPEAVPLYPEMRVVEYLQFRAELKRVPRAERRRNVDDAMVKARVDDVATRMIGKLSKGYRQRVGIADALVARPPILILDEPTAGLDPNQVREVRALVKELGQKHVVVLSTHILSEVEASCTRVLLIHRGRLVAEGQTDRIRRMARPSGLAIAARGEEAKARAALASVKGLTCPSVSSEDAGVLSLECRYEAGLGEAAAARAAEDAIAALVAAGLAVRAARPVGSSLEDVFASLTEEARA